MILEAAADHDTGLVSRGVRHDGIVAGGSGNSDSHREELNHQSAEASPVIISSQLTITSEYQDPDERHPSLFQ